MCTLVPVKVAPTLGLMPREMWKRIKRGGVHVYACTFEDCEYSSGRVEMARRHCLRRHCLRKHPRQQKEDDQVGGGEEKEVAVHGNVLGGVNGGKRRFAECASFSSGEVVNVVWAGRSGRTGAALYPGTVTRVHSGALYDVAFEKGVGGGAEEKVEGRFLKRRMATPTTEECWPKR